MKKTFIYLAAAAVAAVACNKAQTESATAPKVEVEITVADPTPATKAVKTGWESGDVINVYFQDNTDISEPELTLTYNGSKWVASELSSATISALEANPSGKLKGFWEASNSALKAGTAYSDYGAGADYPNYSNSATTGITGYVTTLFNDVSYTYSAGKLTASITAWTIAMNLQIVVSGVSYEEGRYTLYSNKVGNPSSIVLNGGSNSDLADATVYSSGESSGRIAGIANTDGVAFVGRISSDHSSSQSVTLYLKDNTENKTYSLTNPSAELYSAGMTKLCAVKIPFSKFTPLT